MNSFALLDDRDATAARPTSRLYTGFVREHRCVDPASLDDVWAAADADLRTGLHAVLLADYEWGAKLLRAGHERLGADDASAVRVLMYRSLQQLSRNEVDAWLADAAAADAHNTLPAAGFMGLESRVDHGEFTTCIDRIHEAIRNGETYQVNYTYRMTGQAFGSPAHLYQLLRARQPVEFGAFIALPAGESGTPVRHVLSCSPELFLRVEDGVATARPMKGTAGRYVAPEGDSETARLLHDDIKNRAENLMIVDLLRNDLGRIAQIGSVKVPSLFAIEPYATVFQMTSTIKAKLLPDLGMPTLLRAMFPCGSITGAPKIRTMQIISQLESSARGLYCGAIGWIDAPRGDAKVGNLCLSVAIRTLTLGEPRAGLRPATLGVGAGIVLDSTADDEFEECRLKARFATGLDPGFELFETMRAEGRGVALLDRHLHRLAASAKALGFAFDGDAARKVIAQRLTALVGATPWRLRLALSHNGRLQLTHAALTDLPTEPGGMVALRISAQRLLPGNPLAAHKTTLRAHYDVGLRDAEQAGAFDTLFLTKDGRVAEGGRSNVLARIDGRWTTPPLADGALPGVMRAVLVDDPAWRLTERSLTLDDLRRAEDLAVCNALRGVLPARLDESDDVSRTGPGRGTPALTGRSDASDERRRRLEAILAGAQLAAAGR